MNRKEVKAKRYSAVAIVALCAVLSSMLVMRHATKRMTNEILHITAPTTTLAAGVENEVKNVPDPRIPEREDTGEFTQPTEETTATPTTETTAVPTKPQVQTTAPTTAAPPVTEAAASVKNDHYIMPIENTQTAKEFSPEVLLFSATMRDWRTHSGIDFAADTGSEVHSVGNGKVTRVISDPQRGYTIEVDYGTFTGRYCGISQENAVGIDTELHTGDMIGTLGDLPLESADPPHLHFEALQNGEPVDPMNFLGR